MAKERILIDDESDIVPLRANFEPDLVLKDVDLSEELEEED